MNNNISFRKLKKEDLNLIYKWHTNDFIHEWYGKEHEWTFQKVEEDYLPKINGDEPEQPFLIVINGVDIGYIQTYMISDFPDYSKDCNVNIDAAAMDLFIGEREYIHKGLGKDIMTKFLLDYVFILNDSDYCIVGPEPKNKSAIKAYEKTGFKYLKNILVGDEKAPEYLMMICKDDIEKKN
ncbi:MAG: GNAT family N-acetyltransferase [Clostridiales bacterium]|nr:GNAT family N-acetyltransferase [Clostridiales bacterium]